MSMMETVEKDIQRFPSTGFRGVWHGRSAAGLQKIEEIYQ
jgi:hypothetical protein